MKIKITVRTCKACGNEFPYEANGRRGRPPVTCSVQCKRQRQAAQQNRWAESPKGKAVLARLRAQKREEALWENTHLEWWE